MRNTSSLQSVANNEIYLGDFVPHTAQVHPCVVKNDDGAFLVSWRVEGIPFETMDPEDLDIRVNGLNQLCKGLPYGSGIWVHRIRRRVKGSLDGTYQEPFARDMSEKYYAGLSGYKMMVNDTYFTFAYRPEWSLRAAKNRRREPMSLAQIRVREQNAIRVALENAAMIEANLSRFGVERLEIYEKNGHRYSEQLALYGFLLNGFWQEVPLKAANVKQYLPTSRLFFAGERLEIRGATASRYGAILDIKDYPSHTSPGSLDDLLYESYEFIETQSFTILAKSTAKDAVETQKKQLTSTEDSATSQIADLDQALNDLADSQFVMGEYHYTLSVLCESPDGITDALADASRAFNNESFLAAQVDLLADAGWFAQLPGNWQYRPRVATLTSLNFAGLSSLHGFSTGKRNGNPWGEAVTIVKTPNLSPFFLNWHGSPEKEDSTDKKTPANTIIIGMTGSGKTVLELFLLVMSLKYQPTIVFFDKDRGAEIAIRALGGNYRCLRRGMPTGFNPLQLPPTEQNLRFQEQLIQSLIPKKLTPTDEADLNRAIRQVREFPRELQRLSVVRQQLNDHDPDGMRAHLAKWCADENGALAWVLDNPEDTTDLSSGRIFGFDDTDLLNDPTVLAPVTMYLLHLAESLLDGRRFMYVMAEFWKRLEFPVFTGFTVDKQYTIRKLNGMGIFDTQSPDQILKTPHVAAMVEQSATQIFLPNPKADADQYIKGFKLSRKEFEIIKGFGEDSRKFLVKQGHRSVIGHLDLSHLGNDFLDILSTTKDNVELLDQIRAEVGDAPSDWIPVFRERLKERRLGYKNQSSTVFGASHV